jgi:hypothetical protein
MFHWGREFWLIQPLATPVHDASGTTQSGRADAVAVSGRGPGRRPAAPGGGELKPSAST